MDNILFLDDSEDRTNFFLKFFPEACCVKEADECTNMLLKSWDVVYLDHDLGGKVLVSESESNTGSEVVRWVKNNRPDVKLFIIHSMNFPAVDNMRKNLEDCHYPVVVLPIVQMKTIFEDKDTFDLFLKNIEAKINLDK